MEKHIFLRSGQLRRMQLSGDLWPHRGGEGGIPGESMLRVGGAWGECYTDGKMGFVWFIETDKHCHPPI